MYKYTHLERCLLKNKKLTFIRYLQLNTESGHKDTLANFLSTSEICEFCTVIYYAKSQMSMPKAKWFKEMPETQIKYDT